MAPRRNPKCVFPECPEKAREYTIISADFILTAEVCDTHLSTEPITAIAKHGNFQRKRGRPRRRFGDLEYGQT